MIEMLEFLDRHRISPVALFTINKKPDWGAIEFDYLGINQNQLMAEAM